MSDSLLGVTRPDIWTRALDLSVGLTGYTYAPKQPLADGTIYACGGGVYSPPITDGSIREKIHKQEQLIRKYEKYPTYQRGLIEELERLQEELRKFREEESKQLASTVFVPEGSAEWLLHEVGHWIAATDTERRAQHYGLASLADDHGADREWQAWAFEEIVLAPYGSSREFATPMTRDGEAFTRHGPMPQRYLRHVEQRLDELQIDLEPWRVVWGDWVKWGRSMGHKAPWRSTN